MISVDILSKTEMKQISADIGQDIGDVFSPAIPILVSWGNIGPV